MNTITNQRRWPGSPLLRAVGQSLDEGLEVVTYEGGFVWPATKHVPRALAGLLEEVSIDGAQPEESPGASGASGAPRAPRAPRAPGAPAGEAASRPSDTGSGASLVRSVAAPALIFRAEVLPRYPQFGMRVSSTSGESSASGMIQPLADLTFSATVIVQCSADSVRGWAWWQPGVWVGPRHTYNDGSICAFEPSHGTWSPERGLEALLDLYSVWLTKQLHLRAYGTWPGLQRVHTPLERLAEQHPNELCGCGRNVTYARCCFLNDQMKVHSDEVDRRRIELLHRGPMLTSTEAARGKTIPV